MNFEKIKSFFKRNQHPIVSLKIIKEMAGFHDGEILIKQDGMYKVHVAFGTKNQANDFSKDVIVKYPFLNDSVFIFENKLPDSHYWKVTLPQKNIKYEQ